MTDSDFEIGIVKSVADGKTIVEMKPGEVCESCSARLFCRPGKDGRHEMPVLNTIGAQPGQTVELDETGNLLLMISLLQYGLPLLGLVAGVFLIHGINPIQQIMPPELLMAIAGLFGLILGGGGAYLILKILSNRTTNVFRITAVHPSRH